MRNILIIAIVCTYISPSWGCETEKYTVYYVPLEICELNDVNVKSEEYKVKVDACTIAELFEEVSKSSVRRVWPFAETIRIIIIRESDNQELYVAQGPVVFSYEKEERYDVSQELLEDIINKIHSKSIWNEWKRLDGALGIE